MVDLSTAHWSVVEVMATRVGFFHVCLSQHFSLDVVASSKHTYNVNIESVIIYVYTGDAPNIWCLYKSSPGWPKDLTITARPLATAHELIYRYCSLNPGGGVHSG